MAEYRRQTRVQPQILLKTKKIEMGNKIMTKSEYETLQAKFNEKIKQNGMQYWADV